MFKNKLIKEVVGRGQNYKDHYGVEIEVELKRRYEGGYDEQLWRVEGDGSLKQNGYEFVLRNPLTLKAAQEACEALLQHLNDVNQILNNGRAGVHVHVNVSDLTVQQVGNFSALAFTHEPLLANFCGELRQGNLFCLRMRDAEYIVDRLHDFFVKEDVDVLHTDRIRYAFINYKALPQYGSIEFRGMRSDGDVNAIITWLGILDQLKQKARNVDNPVQVVAELSHRTPDNFVKDVMGKYEPVLTTFKGWQDSVMDSIRVVQNFAYAKEW